MRIEKTYLVQEVAEKLKTTPYIYLVNFSKLTVSETAELRRILKTDGACFHVVKNAFLRKIGTDLEWPSLDACLQGQTAIVFGGSNPSGVIKNLLAFSKEKEKLTNKGGIVDGKFLTVANLTELSKLPDLPTLRAMLLSLFLTPAKQSLYVMQAVPQGVVNILKAYENKK